MDEVMEEFNLFAKVRGKNEFEMYKNYIEEITEKKIRNTLDKLYMKPYEKCDTEASLIRHDGNVVFRRMPLSYKEVNYMFTESLRLAEYDGEEYAKALAARIMANFAFLCYSLCLKDIEVCLKANCPPIVKARVLYVKGIILKRVGRDDEKLGILNELLEIVAELPEGSADEFRKYAENLKSKEKYPDGNKIQNPDYLRLPTGMEKNPSFLGASKAVRFESDPEAGYRVVANRDIKQGDIIFLERAYAYAPIKEQEVAIADGPEGDGNLVLRTPCSYCAGSIFIGIPCKNCTRDLYCGETCRDKAVDEFHRWECLADNEIMLGLNHHGYLAIRILFAAVSSRSLLTNVKPIEDKFGDSQDNYRFVYNLPTNLKKINKESLTMHCAMAALYVHYLKEKTDFFSHVKKLSGFSKKNASDRMNIIGALFVRHCAQLHRYVAPIRTVVPSNMPETSFRRICYVALNGIAMCPSLGLMTNSCFPNTALTFLGDMAVVKAITDIQKGEAVTRRYSNILLNDVFTKFEYAERERRRSLLKEYCLLDCLCISCSNPMMKDRIMDAYKCAKCKGPAAKVDNNGRVACSVCKGKYFLSEDVAIKEEKVNCIIRKGQAERSASELFECLEILRSIYVDSHVMFLTIYDELRSFYLREGKLIDFLHCAKLLLAHQKLRSFNFVKVGTYYYGICAMAYPLIYKKCLNFTTEEVQQVLSLTRELLMESESILEYYCPTFIFYITEMKKDLERFEEIHLARSL